MAAILNGHDDAPWLIQNAQWFAILAIIVGVFVLLAIVLSAVTNRHLKPDIGLVILEVPTFNSSNDLLSGRATNRLARRNNSG
ncbi:hypothetical protein, partial [Marinobacter antarcticus]